MLGHCGFFTTNGGFKDCYQFLSSTLSVDDLNTSMHAWGFALMTDKMAGAWIPTLLAIVRGMCDVALVLLVGPVWSSCTISI